MFSLSFKNLSSEEEFRAAFELLDDDNDGLIAVSKVVQVFSSLEPTLERNQVNELIFKAFPEQASNFRTFFQEGSITYSDFVKMMTQ